MHYHIFVFCKPGSSVSVVSGYGLYDRGSRFGFRQMQKDFSSSHCVQIGYGAHPASCPMGTEGPFLGAKARPGRNADHSPHLVSRSKMGRSYTPLPQSPSWRVVGQL
jgi:hypothetical protein